MAGFSGICHGREKEKEKEAKEKTEKTTNTRRNKGTRECSPTERSHRSTPKEEVQRQDTRKYGGTRAGTEEEHLEQPPPASPTKAQQGEHGKRSPTDAPSRFPEKTLPPPKSPTKKMEPQQPKEPIQVARTKELPPGAKVQHEGQTQWLGRPSKRKLPMGNRKKRRKTVARRRSKQLGMELVVSEVPLERIHFSVLHKGRSYVPGPPGKKKSWEDFQASLEDLQGTINKRFTASLQPGASTGELKEKKKLPQQLPSKKMKSLPPRKMPGLENMIKCELFEVYQAWEKKERPNLTKEEQKALKELAENPNIVIKKADKDGALVVLKTCNYIAMGEKHLMDKETYIELSNPEEALAMVKRESKLLVNRFFTLDRPGKEGRQRRSFSAGQRDALLEHEPSIPHWYVLPKTHKPLDQVTGTWPGRPVLSGCSSPTRPVDRLLTTYLTPLLDLLPERLQDTTSFLQKMRDAKRYPGAILFSFDIVSLYPSIPQEEAAYIVANFYEQNFSYVEERLFSDFNMAAPPPYLIKEGIDHVLGGTLLRFNNKFYRQGKGTAIGASVSVAVAEIFVHASIEKKRKQLNKQPEIFYRYIDDIFGIFLGTEEELQAYHEGLNSIHPDLQFTLEHSREKLPFLDTMVYFDDEGGPQTTVFYKPSNTHQYLHYMSSHHPNLKKSLPFSQALRIKRIVSEEPKLEEALQEMTGFFKARGYDNRCLNSALERVGKLNRNHLLTRKVRDNHNRIIFPLLYSPALAGPVRQFLNEVWEWIMENSKDTPWEPAFRTPPPMIAWKKGKSIAEKLIRAQFPSPLVEHKERMDDSTQN